MKQFFIYILLLLAAFSCIDEPEIKVKIPKGRTLLVYVAIDNSLSDEMPQMQEALLDGWNAKTMGSLVILADSKRSKPMLMKLEERKGKAVYDTLRVYTNENSASPELLRQVISDTKELAAGESYGMLLFSHASGWLPQDAFKNPLKWEANYNNLSSIASRSVFEDSGSEMELADFAAAIPDGMFDFIASEMCFMSGVEIAYALRKKTDYILASAPEMLSPGFVPIYKTSLDLLYKPKADLEGFGQAFFNHFDGLEGAYRSAAISLIRTSEMDALAELTRKISPNLKENQFVIDQIQYYDGNYRSAHWPHLFFDFADYMSHAATAQEINELEEQLSRTVIFKRNTEKLINIKLEKHSGLSVYIPQSVLPNLNKEYKKTEWYKATNK